MFSGAVKSSARRVAEPLALGLGKLGLTPNALTILGVMLNAGVAVVLAYGHLQLGGVLVLVVSAFDMLDGALARASQRVTRFGAFLDSTLDRYSEAFLFMGLLFFYTPLGDVVANLLLVGALVGSLMVSYTRARAEGLGIQCEVGLLARPERIIILGVGLIVGYPVWALGIIAALANFTAVQRMWAVWTASGGK